MKRILNIVLISLIAFVPFVTITYNPQVAFATDAFGNMKIDKDGNLTGVEKKTTAAGFNTIFEKYRTVIAGVAGIVAISMLLFFILQAFRLSSSAHNPSERQKAIQGLIWIGIGTALSGSVSLFAGLFYGMLS